MYISVKEEWRKYKKYIAEKEKLSKVCNMICKNYDELELELLRITDFLSNLKELVENYGDAENEIISMQMRYNESLNNAKTVRRIVEEIATINQNAVIEIFDGIDLFEILNLVTNMKSRSERLLLVWKATNMLNDIKYQIKRISVAEDDEKKVTILRGMIALY